jgi:hypothetical protein
MKFTTRWETGCILKMQTKRPSEQQEEEERDIELENIVGNLMIAEYQVDRLRTRLGDRTSGSSSFGPGTGTNKKGSTHVFKHNNKWYKISLKIEELIVDRKVDTKEQENVDGNTYSSSW